MNQENELPKSKRILREILEWILVIVTAVVIVVILRNFVFQLVVVKGPSMESTLHDQERLFVLKTEYLISHKANQGDIVIFMHEKGVFDMFLLWDEIDYVKRVIAVPGQTVDIHDGNVYVDGKLLDEPYIKESNASTKTGNREYPVTVGPDEYFVIGDNRNNSSDSRLVEVGLIKFEDIRGKAIFRLYPFDKMGTLN